MDTRQRAMHADQPGQVTVQHHAMATEFAITIEHADTRYARQAAAEAFRELDRLERCWSAFREDSDVARLARLAGGQTGRVDPDTFACLTWALELERRTGGAFNIAYRAHPPRSTAESIRLDAMAPVVEMLGAGVLLDLGGIGKGFALDRLAALLAEWDLRQVLLRASKSTVLAGQAPAGQTAWKLRFGTPLSPQEMPLCNAALSGSGTDVKGLHIIDPHTGRPANHRRLAFAVAPTGAEADALSTAFLVMTESAIQASCAAHPAVAAYVVRAEDDRVQVLQTPHTAPP